MMLTEWHFNYEARFLNQFFVKPNFAFIELYLWRSCVALLAIEACHRHFGSYNNCNHFTELIDPTVLRVDRFS